MDDSWFKKEVLPISRRKNYILYVGNLKPHKNLLRVLKAFLLLRDSNLNFKIVGRVKNLRTVDEEVYKIINRMKYRIEFLEDIDDIELYNLYREARLLIFPSIYEGFGYPPLEAMACGTPVVASNVASIPEVCGDAAFYINPYDVSDIVRGLKEILNNEKLSESLIEKGLKRVKLFSWQNFVEKFLSIIGNII